MCLGAHADLYMNASKYLFLYLFYKIYEASNHCQIIVPQWRRKFIPQGRGSHAKGSSPEILSQVIAEISQNARSCMSSAVTENYTLPSEHL
jgi:hypothetical protein